MEGQEEITENNDAPVLNVDEANSGDSLIENSGEQQETQEAQTQETQDQQEVEIDAFDPQAFLQGDSLEETKEEVKEEVKEEDDAAAWPDIDGSSETVKEEVKGETKEEVKEEEKNSLDPEQFKLFTNELGIEAESIDDIKNALEKITKENKELKEAGIPKESNKKVEDLENFSKLDDESLVRKSYEADGLTGEKLENVIDRLLDSGMMDIEALKIRNNIDKAIQGERLNIEEAKKSEVAKQQQERQDAVESFSKFMQSTDTLFDFKLTGNPDNLPNVRKNHIEYVTSGKYISEITSDEKSLAESAWLWRNRETLKKAMINNGRQNGRKEILDQINKPESSKPQRFTNPQNPGEFNPKEFMKG